MLRYHSQAEPFALCFLATFFQLEKSLEALAQLSRYEQVVDEALTVLLDGTNDVDVPILLERNGESWRLLLQVSWPSLCRLHQQQLEYARFENGCLKHAKEDDEDEVPELGTRFQATI